MRGSHVDIYNHDENAATYARDVLRSDDPIREGYTEVLDWSAQIARAVENGLTVIAADVAGHQDKFVSYGSTNIIDPNGAVIASSKPFVEDLLIADIEPEADKERRGWDSSKNPAIVRVFLEECYPESSQALDAFN